MKIRYLLIFLLPYLLISCADKPTISSAVLRDVTPLRTVKPDTDKIVGKVNETSNSVARVSNDVKNAAKNLEEVKKGVEEAVNINRDFKDAIAKLTDEFQGDMLRINERFKASLARSSDTIKQLKNNLTDALTEVADLNILLDESKVLIADQRAEIEVRDLEVTTLRKLNDTLITEKAEDEKHKEVAEERLKYVWLFWMLLVAVISYVILKIR